MHTVVFWLFVIAIFELFYLSQVSIRLDNESDVFQALEHHLEYAFNKGNIKSCISIFRQRLPGEELGPRIINHQLLRFAGYRSSEGVVTGDPQEVSMTDFAVQLGWHPPHTAFDLLPLMFQWPGGRRNKRPRTFSGKYRTSVFRMVSHAELEMVCRSGDC